MSKTTSINAALLAIQRDIEAVGKERKNPQQGYNFRGIDDIMNEVHPLFTKHGVFVTSNVLEQNREERPSKSGGVLIYTILKIKFTFHAEDGSTVECEMVGEGMDSGDKSSAKACSIAFKYTILQMFTIPTKDFAIDPETDSPEPLPKTPPKASSTQDGTSLFPRVVALAQQAAQAKKPWREVVWHCTFGTNKAKTLDYKGLTLEAILKADPEGFAYWARQYKQLAKGGPARVAEDALRLALDEATMEFAQAEASPPEPQPDTLPMDTVPATTETPLQEFIRLLEEYGLDQAWALGKINVKRKIKAEALADLDIPTLKKAIENMPWFIAENEKEQK